MMPPDFEYLKARGEWIARARELADKLNKARHSTAQIPTNAEFVIMEALEELMHGEIQRRPAVNVSLRAPLTYDECQQVRLWRNDPLVLPMLRTGFKTEAQQAKFYRTVINPSLVRRFSDWVYGGPDHLYYAVVVGNHCVGMAGLTYLRRVPGEAEISLVLGPQYRRVGIGGKAVDLILEEAWRLGLHAVIGECYPSGNIRFWKTQVEKRGAELHRNEQGSWTWRWEKP